MKLLTFALVASVAFAPIAYATSLGDSGMNLRSTYETSTGAGDYVVDSAPSGFENSVIIDGTSSSLGLPGSDSIVVESQTAPGSMQIEFGTGSGANGPFDANPDTATIVLDDKPVE